ncbi:MAG: hypothetical protein PVI91_12625 [Gammaproteobacteria bacterium]|jgi:hypothetical protein
MPSPRLEPEAQRIEFLVRRDGEAAARDWVRRTLEAYRDAVSNPSSHASLPQYRALFRQSIAAFEDWLEMTSARAENDQPIDN